LKEKDAYFRCIAASALGNIRDARAVKPLLQMLTDSEITARISAVVALGEIRDFRAVDPLGEIYDVAASGASSSEFEDCSQFAAIACLLDIHNIRKEAAIALGKIGGRRAIEILSNVLAAYGPDTHRDAVDALVMIGGVETVNALRIGLKSSDPSARLAAIEGLRKTGSTEAVDLLLNLLSDTSEQVRRATVAALATIKNRNSLPYLRALLSGRSAERNREFRAYIRTTIALIEKDTAGVVGLPRSDGPNFPRTTALPRVADPTPELNRRPRWVDEYGEI